MKRLVIFAVLAILLAGCGQQAVIPETQPETLWETTLPAEPPMVAEVTVATEPVVQEAAALIEPPPPPVSVVLQPEAPGLRETRCDAAVVDYSNAAQGYIMVCHPGETSRRLKVLVEGPTTTYKYNLPQGQWTVFPLSDGDGNYQVGVYRNTEGSKYVAVMSAKFTVTLEDPFAPFLRPNQYVDYLDAPDTVAMGAALCAGITAPLEKVAVIYDYVVKNLYYDTEKAATVKSGYLPVLDTVLEEKKGICFDYAALMTAMLRSQEVPCKLVVGYAGSVYHAWISVWTEENGWVDGVIFFDGHSWKRMDPTFASSADNQEEILAFIENGNYTVKYLY